MTASLFTPQRARRTAERLRPTLERIRILYTTLERRAPVRRGPDQLVEPRYLALVVALHELLETVRRSGVATVDVRGGGVHFPARRAGRAVVLCWSPDREALAWRDPAQAAAGPRPVVDDDAWEG